MIDLRAYLDRIGYAGPRDATLATLRGVCAAHPAALAFENLDPLLGRVPSLSLEALQAKMVAQRRGGYCFEHNALLRAALIDLGFGVTSLSARVVLGAPAQAPPRPRTHMLLQVSLARGPTYLVDAGFGGHVLNAPLEIAPGAQQGTPTGAQRILLADDGCHVVEVQQGEDWAALYRFTLEPHEAVDYEPLNWFTATHPGSIFRHNLLLERLTASGRASLLNDRLTLRSRLGAVQARVVGSASEFAELLEGVFDIDPPAPAADVFARIPKGLLKPFIPAPA